ncbi:MAG: glycosyltransferase family 4 protein [Planctomycetes bacterium]|nr:glycosyltransferase family 4 protein [Planctomycetota bacterium]
MRITFLSPAPSMAGGTRVIAIMARQLSARGHDVTVVATSWPKRSMREVFRDLKKGILVQPPLRSHLDGLPLKIIRLPDSGPITDAEVPDADIVVATWWETAEWAKELSPSKGRKIYFVQGHEVFPNLPLDRCRATYRLPFPKIVVSRWLAEVMAEEYGDHDVHLVQNGVDHKQFFAPPRGRHAAPTVGFLYSTSEIKGGDVAMRVIGDLMRRNPGLRVVSFSTQEFKQARRLGIEFHHHPPQAEIRDLYAACDVWLSTSRSEGFNLPAMEAMACRTPVVSTRTGWPKHGIVEGVTGHTAEIDDVDGLVGAVEKVLALDDAGWRAMSEAAFQSVAECTWERAVDEFEATLKKIAQS